MTGHTTHNITKKILTENIIKNKIKMILSKVTEMIMDREALFVMNHNEMMTDK